MKNSKIIHSLNKIEPSDSANSRMLSAILAENRRVHGEKENGMITSKKRVGKRAMILAIAAVLVVSLAVGAGATGALGRLFSIITQNDGANDYNADNLKLVAERMEPVTDEVTATQAGDLKFSVKETYYDGMTLYCVGEIETSLDPNAKQTDWNYDIFINGEQLDFDYTLNVRKWVKMDEGRYINDSLSTKIPVEFRPADTDEIHVKYVATHYRYGSEEDSGTDSGLLEAASSEFTVAYHDETIRISEPVEQNGVKFLYFQSTPATTEIGMDVPRDLAGYYPNYDSNIRLVTEDGKPVTLNTGSSRESDDPETYWRLIYSGEAVPNGAGKVIAQLITSDASKHNEAVTAKFLIDLEEKTVAPVE